MHLPHLHLATTEYSQPQTSLIPLKSTFLHCGFQRQSGAFCSDFQVICCLGSIFVSLVASLEIARTWPSIGSCRPIKLLHKPCISSPTPRLYFKSKMRCKVKESKWARKQEVDVMKAKWHDDRSATVHTNIYINFLQIWQSACTIVFVFNWLIAFTSISHTVTWIIIKKSHSWCVKQHVEMKNRKFAPMCRARG